jgi:hypothetical protein
MSIENTFLREFWPEKPGQTNLTITAGEMEEFCHFMAKRSGWWINPGDGSDRTETGDFNVAAMVLSIINEVTCAAHGVEIPQQDELMPEREALEVRLAGAVIRIFNLGQACGFDLTTTMWDMLALNQQYTEQNDD